jgi:hypothetical protein
MHAPCHAKWSKLSFSPAVFIDLSSLFLSIFQQTPRAWCNNIFNPLLTERSDRQALCGSFTILTPLQPTTLQSTRKSLRTTLLSIGKRLEFEDWSF